MVFFNEKKSNFISLYLKYKVPCHHTIQSYDLLSEISKNMYMQKLNYPPCDDDNRILKISFIGKLSELNKFRSNLIEEEINKKFIFLTKKNINEMEVLLNGIEKINLAQLNKLTQINKLKNDTELNLKQHKIHENSNTQFEILETKILNKIGFFNFKYSLLISSLIYCILLVIKYLVSVRAFCFRFK